MKRTRIACALGAVMAAVMLSPTAAATASTQPIHPALHAGLAARSVPASGYEAPRVSGPDDWVLGDANWFENLNTHKCLDDSTASNGSDLLRDFPCVQASYDSGYQKWIVIRVANVDQYGYAQWGQLQNAATHRCLDWSYQFGLRAFNCSYNSFDGTGMWQAWESWPTSLPTNNGGDVYGWILQNGQSDYGNYCLDDSAPYGVRGFPCNGSSQQAGYQFWTSPLLEP